MRLSRVTTVCFLVAALLFSAAPAGATPPNFSGNVTSATHPIFDAVFYGAKGDGTTDDTTADQNAINAAAAVGGGDVWLPRTGSCGIISSTLIISNSGIRIIGGGIGQSNASGTSCLKWNGASGGTIIKIAPVSGTSSYRLTSNGVSGVQLDANNGLAGYGIAIYSIRGAKIEDASFVGGFSTHALYLGTVATLATGEPGDDQGNVFDRLWFNNTVNTGDAIYLDGGNGNSSFNRFGYLNIVYKNGNGITLNNADNNTFDNVQEGLAAGGAGTGVLLNGNVNSNHFTDLSAPSFHATASTYDNTILFLDDSNGDAPPTIDSGAQLYWGYSAAKFFNGAYGHNAMGSNLSETGQARSRMGASETLRIYNGSGQHMVLDDGTHTWGVNLDSNGNLRFTPSAAASMMSNFNSALSGYGIQLNNGSLGTLSNSAPFIANDLGATAGININVPTGSTYGIRMLVNGSPNAFRIDASGNTSTNIVTEGSHNPCSSSSSWPCETSGSCGLSGATTCSFNVTVPTGAICIATANPSDTTTGVESIRLGAITSNVLPVNITLASSQTATAAANVHCL